jgi:hypothetical protein
MYTLDILEEIFNGMDGTSFLVLFVLIAFTPVIPLFGVAMIIEMIIRFGWWIIKTLFGIKEYDEEYTYYD